MSFSAPERLRSRRMLLTGAAAGATAVAAQAVASPAQAADGDPLILGDENSAETKTILNSADSAVLEVKNTGGATALIARVPGGSGVGLHGIGGTTGVVGTSNHPNGPGVLGECNTGSSNDRGVVGTTHIGQGVAGYTNTGTGLFGTAFQGGKALEVNGRAFFSRSGKLTIPARSTSVVQTGVALTAESLVLATLQENIEGVWIRAAVPDVAKNSFEILLNKKPKRSVSVAWFIVN